MEPQRPSQGSRITSYHKELLSAVGISDQLLLGSDLYSLGPGDVPRLSPGASMPGVGLPLRNPDGVVASSRLFLGMDPLGVPCHPPPRREFVAPPFVASLPGAPEGPIVVVSHDLWAMAVASWTGLTVVSTCGELVLEQAARLAAQRAAGRPVLLLPFFGVPLSRFAANRLVTAARAHARDVRIDPLRGRSREDVTKHRLLAAPMARTRLWDRASALPRVNVADGSLPRIQLLVTDLLRVVVRATLARLIAWFPPRSPVQPVVTNLEPLLEAASEIDRFCRARGAESALFGGVASDLLVGRSLRPRKDVDVVIRGGPDDILEQLARHLIRGGDRLARHRPEAQVVMERGDFVIDVFRLLPGPGTMLTLESLNTCVVFEQGDWRMPVSVRGRSLHVLAPRLLYFLKLLKAADARGLQLRSHWQAMSRERIDVAALGAVVDRRECRRALRTGRVKFLEVTAFSVFPLPNISFAWQPLRSLWRRIASLGQRPQASATCGRTAS